MDETQGRPRISQIPDNADPNWVDIADVIAEEIGNPPVEMRRASRTQLKSSNPTLSEEMLDRTFGADSR